MECAGSIRCSSVEVSKAGIAEFDRKRTIAFVPRERIVEVTLLYGSGAQRPITQTIVGLVLMSVGIVLGVTPVRHFVAELAGIQPNPHIDNYDLKPFVFASTLILIGALLAFDVVRRKYYLLIKSDKGDQKVVFGRAITLAEISEFIDHAQNEFGYNIKVGEKI